MSERRISIDETDPEIMEDDPILRHRDGRVEVTLSRTITVTVKKRSGGTEDREYDSIMFRPMSFGDIKAMANIKVNENAGKKIGDLDLGEIDLAYWLVERLSNVPSAALDEVNGEDMKNCMEAVSFLSKKSQGTPKGASS